MALDGTSQRVLIVDDEAQARDLLGRLLGRAGYECATAAGAAEARARVRDGDFALLLSDVNMPDESGLELVRHVLAEHPATAAIMVTGVDDPKLAEAALDTGSYGYVIKPFTPTEILIAVANALKRRALELENRTHRDELERLVKVRTAALQRSANELKLTREQTVRRLSRAVEYRDHVTGGHIERMSRYAALLASRVGQDEEAIRLASPMHDVGKVALPDRILLKPGALTSGERREMERHAVIGYSILSGSGSELLDTAATIALTHHEKFDGSGYPSGLAGAEIPIEGQLAAVADVFDALTSERPYRSALPVEESLEIMSGDRGAHFNPELLDAFLNLRDEVVAIRDRHPDLPGEPGAEIETRPLS